MYKEEMKKVKHRNFYILFYFFILKSSVLFAAMI